MRPPLLAVVLAQILNLEVRPFEDQLGVPEVEPRLASVARRFLGSYVTATRLA